MGECGGFLLEFRDVCEIGHRKYLPQLCVVLI